MKPALEFFLVLALAAVTAAQTEAAVDEKKPARLEGLVINSVTGEPLGHAHIRFFRERFEAEGSYGATTTLDGRFSIKSVVPAEYWILLERRGFISLWPREDDPSAKKTVKPGEEVKDLILRLLPAAVISGRVLTPDGEPMEAITVEALGIRGWAMARTNDRGEFRLGGLEPGRYLLVGWSYAGDTAPAEIRTDGTTEINPVATFYTDSLHADGATPVEVRAGAETKGIEIRLRSVPIVRVSGRVTAIPESCRDLHVRLGGGDDRLTVEWGGTFTTPRMRPGRWQMWAACTDKNGVSLYSAPIEIEVANHNVDNIVLPLMRVFPISGHIELREPDAVSKDEKQPKLQLLQLGTLSPVNAPRPEGLEADIDQHGSFALDAIKPDQYYVMVTGFPEDFYVKSIRAGDKETYDGTLDLRHGAPRGELVVTLGSNGAEICGVIRDQNGNKTKARTLVLLDNDFGLDIIADLESDNDGKYCVKGLAPGKYRLIAGDPDSFSFATTISLFESVIEPIQVGEGEKLKQDLKVLAD